MQSRGAEIGYLRFLALSLNSIMRSASASAFALGGILPDSQDLYSSPDIGISFRAGVPPPKSAARSGSISSAVIKTRLKGVAADTVHQR
jgi:hypothetical protein